MGKWYFHTTHTTATPTLNLWPCEFNQETAKICANLDRWSLRYRKIAKTLLPWESRLKEESTRIFYNQRQGGQRWFVMYRRTITEFKTTCPGTVQNTIDSCRRIWTIYNNKYKKNNYKFVQLIWFLSGCHLHSCFRLSRYRLSSFVYTFTNPPKPASEIRINKILSMSIYRFEREPAFWLNDILWWYIETDAGWLTTGND